jgi:hypothetical protein
MGHYKQFTQHDWERGAHVHYWLSTAYNRPAMDRLSDYIANAGADDEDRFHYSFGERCLGPDEVDLLVEYGQSALVAHFRVDGFLHLPAELEEYIPARWFVPAPSIRGMFHPERSTQTWEDHPPHRGFEEVTISHEISDVLPLRMKDLREFVAETEHLPAGARLEVEGIHTTAPFSLLSGGVLTIDAPVTIRRLVATNTTQRPVRG